MTNKVVSHSNRSLDEWLSYIESIHATEIDMGLERISCVADRLAFNFEASTVITVAGTNGKGTTCAFLENALLVIGETVAVYSSPHITRFNERLRLNKRDIDDASLVSAFEQVEACRQDISLTYYEFTTLAALLVLNVQQPRYIILEVGLGGRLDATNIIDADIAVVTTVDLDHQVFLGNDRESIGYEKSGIMRAQKPVVVGDIAPPLSVSSYTKNIGAIGYFRNQEFFVEVTDNTWHWKNANIVLNNLPFGHIPSDNIATALQVLVLLKYPVNVENIAALIMQTKVAGRTEVIFDGCNVMLDVGHNPLAARYLANVIAKHSYDKVYAVFSMLADKDVKNTIAPLISNIDKWYLAGLEDIPRGRTGKQLASLFDEQNILTFDNVDDAYKMAKSTANNNDLILVFGSFYTVAKVKALLDRS